MRAGGARESSFEMSLAVRLRLAIREFHGSIMLLTRKREGVGGGRGKDNYSPTSLVCHRARRGGETMEIPTVCKFHFYDSYRTQQRS